MKKVLIFLISSIVVGMACQKKAVPVITERKYVPPKGVVTTFPPPGIIAADTAIGKMVFVNRCGKCHGLPEPVQFTAKRWDGILSYMIPKARIVGEDAVHLKAYVLANALK